MELLTFGIIFILANASILYFFYTLFLKKINENINNNKNEDINIKIELLREQIKLGTIIMHNNSVLISKNKKDIDAFEAFINAALTINDNDVIH
jgi:hypothetical protein